MSLNPKKLYLYNIICKILPISKCFGFKARMLRWCGARIGTNVRICSTAQISGCGELSIGDNTWVGSETIISSGATIHIGANVDIGPRVCIVTGSHEIDPIGVHSAGPGYNSDLYIKDGVWIGAGSILVPAPKNTIRIIGKKTVIAAGSVVTTNAKDYSIIAGVPARYLRSIKQ